MRTIGIESRLFYIPITVILQDFSRASQWSALPLHRARVDIQVSSCLRWNCSETDWPSFWNNIATNAIIVNSKAAEIHFVYFILRKHRYGFPSLGSAGVVFFVGLLMVSKRGKLKAVFIEVSTHLLRLARDLEEKAASCLACSQKKKEKRSKKKKKLSS